jgi:type VI secretion system protein ImpM
MNSHALGPECPGWFGKIPSLGDFASRRLPLSFVKPWDEWLSTELSDARCALAQEWAEIYARAPISCFSLQPRTVDDHAWFGIVVPSYDRVGRQFPLTIARSLPPPATGTGAQRWWARLLAIGQRALEPGCGADEVDEALAALVGDESAADVAAPGSTPPHAAAPSTVPNAAVLAEGMSAWRRASPEGAADLASDMCSGLPRGAGFRRRLLGAR